jgi:hypothetical protein
MPDPARPGVFVPDQGCQLVSRDRRAGELAAARIEADGDDVRVLAADDDPGRRQRV